MKHTMEVPKATAYESLARMFSFTAQSMERLPRLMQEIGSYQMRLPGPAKTATPTRAEMVLRFPSLAGVQNIGPTPIKSLIRSALDRAVNSEEPPQTTALDAAVSVLAALFFRRPDPP